MYNLPVRVHLHPLKPIVYIFIILLLGKYTYGQANFYPFGMFPADEVSMKECNFDSHAEAIILMDRAVATYNDEQNLVTDRRIRIKILKESGVDRGQILIPYYSLNNFEKIQDIDAVVSNYDSYNTEAKSILDKKAIYTRQLNKYYSAYTFALPNIKVGSIIEYKYTSIMKNYGGLEEWNFQSDLPVKLSSFHLVILPHAEFAYTVYKKNDLPVKIIPDKASGSILFEMGKCSFTQRRAIYECQE